MRTRRFSEEQMVGILREADKDPVARVAKVKASVNRICTGDSPSGHERRRRQTLASVGAGE